MMRAYHASQGHLGPGVYHPRQRTRHEPGELHARPAGRREDRQERRRHHPPRGGLSAPSSARRNGDVCGLMMTNPNTRSACTRNSPRHRRSSSTTRRPRLRRRRQHQRDHGRRAGPAISASTSSASTCTISFTTPHGGGGPGSGPVASSSTSSRSRLRRSVVKRGDAFALDPGRPHTVRPPSPFPSQPSGCSSANTPTFARDGRRGLTRASFALAVLNARYLWAKLKDHYVAPVPQPCMHEIVLSDSRLEKETGVKTLDVAKRLLDYGFHAPTVYFPLVFPESAHDRAPPDRDTRRRSTSSSAR